ncbi:polysaccharide pyruvyl transferase family protein [Microbacterium sp. NPDC089987]|uniref:polysaccharide pyruvyl transferase family protein n=1 Tax=Microbacterium sp. NPDC089987 TaxID=3364202 RepID=UPI0038239DCD
MKRVHAVGYYGWDNFGDELFRATVELNRELLWGPGARVRSFVTPLPWLHQNLGIIGRGTRLLETTAGMLWSNTTALCGGSVLEDVRGVERVRAAVRFGRKSIEAIGVSLGPWASLAASDRVRAYIDSMDRVVVRDQASATRLGQHSGITVGGDLAALYPMPSIPEKTRTHLTICVSNDSHSSVDDLTKLLAPLLETVDVPTRILALNVRRTHGDVELAGAIKSRLRRLGINVEVARFESVEQTIEMIAQSRAVWSQRLHGLIVAYLCGVPIIALSHHQKITDFAEDIGLPSRFFRRTLEPDSDLTRAAVESLTVPQEWRVPPAEYVESARRALAAAQHR